MAIIPSNMNRNIIVKEAGSILPNSYYAGIKLYHYCNSYGFLGILKSEKIWLTNTEFLNDWAECLLGDHVLENYKQEIFEKLKKIRPYISFDEIMEHYSRIKKTLRFVCSFSTESDSLSQWVHYANNGAGFCIEYNADEVDHIGQICFDEIPTTTPTDFRYLMLSKVIYADPASSEESINALIDEIVEILKGWGGNPWLGAIHLALLNARIKHDTFIGENEYRMIYLNTSKENSRMISELDYRVCGDNTIAPYYSMSLPQITGVGIGPKNPMKASQVEAMLAEKALRMRARSSRLVRLNDSGCVYYRSRGDRAFRSLQIDFMVKVLISACQEMDDVRCSRAYTQRWEQATPASCCACRS